MVRYERVERAALADALDAVGAEAATLCEGWTTRDLVAHLVIRERRPDAGPGVIIAPLAGHMERVRTTTRDGNAYAGLIETFRSGPPAWSPIRLPFLDAATNTIEYFVHHEDVRRAEPGWAARTLDPAFEDYLWSRLRRGAKVMMRRTPVGLVLDAGERGTVTVKDGAGVVAHGPPSELTLLGFGRGRHTTIEWDGDPKDVEALLGSKFGI